MSDSLISRSYRERVDINKVNKLLSMIENNNLVLDRCEQKNKLLTKDELYNQIKQQLLKYKKHIKNGYANVKYDYVVPNFGRVFATKGTYISMGSMPREIKGTLASDYYIDIDINNCHPVLMVQLCDKYKIACEPLRLYVNNRDKYLKDVMNEYNVDRDAAKILYLQLMYGGSYESWCNSYGIHNHPKPIWLNDFINNISEMYPKLISNYTEQVELLRQHGKPEKEYNRNGAIVSWIMQDAERQVLAVMMDWIARNGKAVGYCVLCFDGFMMLKDKYKPEILHSIEEDVFKKTNFRITLSTKQFTTVDISEVNIENENLEEYIAPVTSYFDIDIFKICSQHNINCAKEYFERFNCYCTDGDNICVYNGISKKVEIIPIKRAQDRYRNLYDYTDFNEKTGEYRLFFNKWLGSTSRRTVHSIDCIPYSGSINIKHVFEDNRVNTFVGFNNLINSLVEEHRNEFNDFYDNYFMKLLYNLCECNEHFTNWMLCYFAQLIQQPANRPLRSVCFVGNQGDGKNALLDAIANVIGKELYHSSSKVSDYFGEHACAHEGKLLINFDESQAKGNYDLEGMIKSFVTSAFIDMNVKYIKQYRVTNNARLICTSNKQSSLPIDFESGNRRFVLFHTTNPNKSVYSKEHIQFFNHYYKIINSDFYPAFMFEKLMSIDISNWNATEELITDQSKRAEQLSNNSLKVFFDENIQEMIKEENTHVTEYFNKDDELIYEIGVKDFHNLYTNFCKQCYFQSTSILNYKFFYNEITTKEKYMKFITHCNSNSRRRFIINLAKYTKYLKENNPDYNCEI